MTAQYKNALVELLRTIAHRERQLEYQRNVPIANVAAELVCEWFDDLYHPEAIFFQNLFTESERARLAKFNEFYGGRVDELPDTLDEMHASRSWHEIEREARQVLIDCHWDEGSDI